MINYYKLDISKTRKAVQLAREVTLRELMTFIAFAGIILIKKINTFNITSPAILALIMCVIATGSIMSVKLITTMEMAKFGARGHNKYVVSEYGSSREYLQALNNEDESIKQYFMVTEYFCSQKAINRATNLCRLSEVLLVYCTVSLAIMGYSPVVVMCGVAIVALFINERNLVIECKNGIKPVEEI